MADEEALRRMERKERAWDCFRLMLTLLPSEASNRIQRAAIEYGNCRSELARHGEDVYE